MILECLLYPAQFLVPRSHVSLGDPQQIVSRLIARRLLVIIAFPSERCGLEVFELVLDL